MTDFVSGVHFGTIPHGSPSRPTVSDPRDFTHNSSVMPHKEFKKTHVFLIQVSFTDSQLGISNNYAYQKVCRDITDMAGHRPPEMWHCVTRVAKHYICLCQTHSLCEMLCRYQTPVSFLQKPWEFKHKPPQVDHMPILASSTLTEQDILKKKSHHDFSLLFPLHYPSPAGDPERILPYSHNRNKNNCTLSGLLPMGKNPLSRILWHLSKTSSCFKQPMTSLLFL